MSETRPILCGICHVSPEGGFERDGKTWAACPVCGQEDRMENILREAAEYHADQGFRRALSGLKHLTVKSPPQRKYRWITSD